MADTGEEAYLRVDIPCGCGAACAACPPTLPALALQGGGGSSGSGRAESGPRQAHLLMPDAAALLDSLEVLELPEVENVVLLTSEVRQVSQPAGPATYHMAREWQGAGPVAPLLGRAAAQRCKHVPAIPKQQSTSIG